MKRNTGVLLVVTDYLHAQQKLKETDNGEADSYPYWWGIIVGIESTSAALGVDIELEAKRF